ncbi:hypothetical protein D3C72_314240 [compost metagenome]
MVAQIDYESTKSHKRHDHIIQDIRFIDIKPAYKNRIKENFKSVFSLKCRHEQLFSDISIVNNLHAIMKKEKPDVVIAESVWCLQAIGELDVEIKLIVHDVVRNFMWEMYISSSGILKKMYFFYDWLRVYFREKKIVNNPRVKEYIFLTEEDKDYYVSKFGIDYTKCKLATNQLSVRKINRNLNEADSFLLFPGSIEFSQNELALKWFCNKVLPEMKCCPKIIVTGRASEKNKKVFERFNVLKFCGEVSLSELDQLYSQCICVIAPIISGTGIKIKTLEAVQMGVPVVTTPFASKGIYSDLCIYGESDTPIEFAKVLTNTISQYISG